MCLTSTSVPNFDMARGPPAAFSDHLHSTINSSTVCRSWTVLHEEYLLDWLLCCCLINNCCVFIIRAFPVWIREEKTLEGWLWSGVCLVCVLVSLHVCSGWETASITPDGISFIKSNRWLRHAACTCWVGPVPSLSVPTADLNATLINLVIFTLI